MKCVVFVFFFVLYGSVVGREGFDVLLVIFVFIDDIGVFFVGDGVFQLLFEQWFGVVLVCDYIVIFKLLLLYDIDQCWLCVDLV